MKRPLAIVIKRTTNQRIQIEKNVQRVKEQHNLFINTLRALVNHQCCSVTNNS